MATINAPNNTRHNHPCCDAYRTIEGRKNRRIVAAKVDGVPAWVTVPTRLLNYIGLPPRRQKLVEAVREQLPKQADALTAYPRYQLEEAPLQDYPETGTATEHPSFDWPASFDPKVHERAEREMYKRRWLKSVTADEVHGLTVMDEAHFIKRKGGLDIDMEALLKMESRTQVRILRDHDV